MYEHEILQLGITKRNKMKNLLNEKSKEGWELVNIIPDIGVNQQGMIETRMLAVIKRPKTTLEANKANTTPETPETPETPAPS